MHKGKKIFLKLFSDGEVPTAIKLEGGGGLMALPLKIKCGYPQILCNDSGKKKMPTQAILYCLKTVVDNICLSEILMIVRPNWSTAQNMACTLHRISNTAFRNHVLGSTNVQSITSPPPLQSLSKQIPHCNVKCKKLQNKIRQILTRLPPPRPAIVQLLILIKLHVLGRYKYGFDVVSLDPNPDPFGMKSLFGFRSCHRVSIVIPLKPVQRYAIIVQQFIRRCCLGQL